MTSELIFAAGNRICICCFSTPEHIIEAGIKALQDGHHGYTPATGDVLDFRATTTASASPRT